MSSTMTSDHRTQSICQEIEDQIRRVVAIEPATLEPMIIALLSRGHVLIEGIPGIGKTLLARTLARTVGLGFTRVQFTNDLMPSDIVGASVWRPGVERFEFVRGPIFSNIVLADEFNRTSPRTLSCLLEAMENGRVSVDGQTHDLPDPFFVLATRNPIEFHGTFPVPEAALDRFLVRVRLEYPSRPQELDLYLGRDPEDALTDLKPVLSRERLLELIAAARDVGVSEPVAGYAYRVVTATREHDAVALGASPRAAMAWIQAARARALINGRTYVLPDDLKSTARPVLAHRVFLRGGGDANDLVASVIGETPVDL